jgi:two-component system, response regulator YesN
MIDVLLVDDEDMIRQGICESIDWNKFNMRVIGQAEDGEEALEIFKECNPQLILTDIKMPFMDGLELVEKVRVQDSETYIIIISGYDDFKYAQKAIKLGATDFILKPIDLECVEEILHKISLDFTERTKKKDNERELKEKVENSLGILQGNFLKDLIFRKRDSQLIEESVKELQIVEADYSVALIVQLDDLEALDEPLFFNEKGVFALEINNKELVILMMGASELSLRNKMNKIGKIVRSEINGSITIAFGKVYPTLLELSHSYGEALKALEYKFILGNGQDIFYERIKDKVKEYSNVINNKDYEAIYSIDFTEKESIQRDIDLLMDNIKNAGRDSYLYSQMIVSNIYMSAIKALKEIGGKVEEVFDNPINEFKQLASNPTIDLVKDHLLVTLYKIADYINERQFGKYTYIIDKAKAFINQNYNNPDFSIESAARYVNISNSYFSILFKQETGQTFVDYLTFFRIEKAKYLLRASSFRSYEISEKVGFNNSTYFSTIFKKYTGYSPSEYRKQILEV